jgi:hypothetical protein
MRPRRHADHALHYLSRDIRPSSGFLGRFSIILTLLARIGLGENRKDSRPSALLASERRPQARGDIFPVIWTQSIRELAVTHDKRMFYAGAASGGGRSSGMSRRMSAKRSHGYRPSSLNVKSHAAKCPSPNLRLLLIAEVPFSGRARVRGRAAHPA